MRLQAENEGYNRVVVFAPFPDVSSNLFLSLRVLQIDGPLMENIKKARLEYTLRVRIEVRQVEGMGIAFLMHLAWNATPTSNVHWIDREANVHVRALTVRPRALSLSLSLLLSTLLRALVSKIVTLRAITRAEIRSRKEKKKKRKKRRNGRRKNEGSPIGTR